ncbi:unnamed protein product [Phytophthora lilii]|uniref:RxLR effector protein n=1 Tax=Phytophthora lilii TaxID=2077276 RepID=A0A9W6U8W7_9STRA|nr:unnamed protein product [Phytophthora lilii]
MRLSYVALVAVLALAGGSINVAAVTSQTGISQVASPEGIRSLSAETEKRNLRAEKTDERADDEDRDLFDYMWDNTVTKNKYRIWYLDGKTPKQVKQMLKRREARGDNVNWALLTGYSKYYMKRQKELINLSD